MDDDDMNSKRDEHMKHVITLQLLELLPKLRDLGISFSDNGHVLSVLCRPCNKCISTLNPARLFHLQHLDGTNHRKKMSNTLTNFENCIVEKKWVKVTLVANGFLMFERANSGIITDKPPVESITEQEKEGSLRNTSSLVSVNLSEIFYANMIELLKIGSLRHACAIILNPTLTSENIVSRVKSTQHTEELLQLYSTNMEAKLLDIPSDLALLFSENFFQHREKEIYCIACSAHLQNVDSLINHTNSKNHKQKLNSFMEILLTATIFNLEENSTHKDFQPSLSAASNSALSPKSAGNQNSTDLKPKLRQTSDELVSLKRQHHVFGEKLHCKICSVDLKIPPNILSHINGKKHQTQLREYKVEQRDKLAKLQQRSSKLQTEDSISDQPKPMMIPDELKPLMSQYLLQHLKKEIYCAACAAHLQTVKSLMNHTNSKNHVAKLNLFMQTILMATFSDLEEESTAKDVQSSLLAAASCSLLLRSVNTRESTDVKLKLVENLYCKIQPDGLLQSIEHNNIDMNPIIKMLDTEHDQKCLQPERYTFLLDTPIGSVNNDIPATVSISTSPAVTTATDTSMSALIGTSSAASSTPSLYNLSTKDSISEKLKHMMIRNVLKPLISQHLLQHSEKGMYCAACTDDLKNFGTLINHTKNDYHTKKLHFLVQAISTEINLHVQEDSTSKDSQPSSSAGANSILFWNSYIIGNNFYCKICRVNLNNSDNILSHINGTNHQTELHKFKVIVQEIFAKPPKKSNGTESIDASTDDCDNSPTAPKVSENLFLQSHDKKNICTNPSIKPMITERDQKCLQQERSVLDRPNVTLNNDIDTTVPLSTSPEFSTAMSTSTTSVLSSTPAAAPSTSSVCDSAINDSISDRPNLMKIPDELKPLISKHMLQHLETEIYCETCSKHLQCAQSVVQHTRSKLHKQNLEYKIKSEKLKSKIEMIEEKMRELKLTSNSLPDADKPLKEINLNENSTKAESNYSSININELYKVSSEKLRIIEMSCQLCFPKSLQTIYCLICTKSTSNNVQNFYEHMFSDLHLQYFAELEANDLLYVDYPNQFSKLTLLKEFIMKLTDETLQCVICDSLVLDLDADISVHIKQKQHVIKKQQLNEQSKEKFLKTVLQRTQSNHDNINNYWCELCDFSSDSAFAFAKHSMDPTDSACLEQRSSHKCDIIYDSCVPCASLWLGFMHTYAHHCQTESHMTNIRIYKMVKEIRLPWEALIYLQQAVKKVEKLIQLSDQVVTKEQSKVGNLLKCLEKTVEPVFPKAKAYPFGSRISGLGFPDSDIDVFLDCGTDFRTTVSEKDEQGIINKVEHCLRGNRKLWKIQKVLTGGRIPIIRLYHESTNLKCDISFNNELAIENTKLLKCFLDNCPMVRRLILFLKKWLAICKLSGMQCITNYALCWYVIFYLQSKTILPSVADLIRQGKKSKTVAGWETGISEKFVPHMADDSFLSLLHGFFQYYAIFNFRKCVACPLLGYTVYKDDFEELSSLPPEMAPYINQLSATIDPALLFRIDSPMCIQDPYDLGHNLTKAISSLNLEIFKQFCEVSAEVLNSNFKMP